MAQVPARTGAPPAEPDWTVTAADTVERVVGSIRDRTTVPLTTVARGIVYGQIAAVMGLAALILVSIVLVRLGANYFGGLVDHDHHYPGRAVWFTEGILGLLFVLSGWWLFRKAGAANSDTKR